MPLQPDDVNMHKAAFYNAMRSSSIENLDNLIQQHEDTDTSSVELDQIISCAYENLKLKNVPLTPEMEAFVENELIKLRFFSNAQGSYFKRDVNNTIERINLVTENISLLVSEYSDDSKNVDGKFLFILSFIAQNMHILKQQLRASYNRLPWEEMEFMLISFVVLHKKKAEENIFSHATLNKSKILTHLDNFSKILKDVKRMIRSSSQGDELPKRKREKVVAEIIAKAPSFQQLYDDHQQIRDVLSLMKMNDYLVLALSVDCKEREGQLIITRVLQVIGEFFKNTLESPKLSNFTSELLLLSLPCNTRNIIMNLRNSLSHAHSLSQRMEIEENSDIDFFFGVQKDMKTINSVIDRILWSKKTELVRTLFTQIIDSESQDEVKDIFGIFQYFDFLTMIKDMCDSTLKEDENNKLKKLIQELEKSLDNQTECEMKLFSQIDKFFSTMNGIKVRTYFIQGLSTFQTFYLAHRNHLQMKRHFFEQIRVYAAEALESIPQPIEIEIVDKITQLVLTIAEREEIDDGSAKLIHEILFYMAWRSADLYWIESISEKLHIKGSFNRQLRSSSIKTEDFKNLLEQKVLKLKSILKENEVNQNSTTFKDNKKLQATVEMLVLDIMSILSGSHLENNMLFLDDNAPLLTGKCLRNHLAHDNTILDVLLSDPTNALIFNAQKLVSEDVLKSDKKVGKLVRDDPNKLRNKYNQNLETVTNQEKLFAALEEGNLENVKSCLDQGADIYGRSINLETALHFAARSSNIKVLKFVLSQGVGMNMNAKDSNGQSALHIAAAYGRKSIVDYLIREKGMDDRDRDNNLQTPLHIAARNGHKGIVDILVRHNSDTTMQDISGFTPLHYAIHHDRIGVINRLLEKQTADKLNERSDNSPLHSAAAYGSPEIVNLLLKKGADVNVENTKNDTPLYFAAQSGNLGIVKTLVANGADVNHKGDDGNTPLFCAIAYGHDKVVRFLLAHKADVNVCNKAGSTPLHFAAMRGMNTAVEALFKNKASDDSVFGLGLAPLHLAVLKGHLKTVDIFVENGANVNIHAKLIDDLTPLHLAAREGHQEIAERLINAGAKVNSKDYENSTPLHEAAIYGKTNVAELLIRYGAKVLLRDADGNTPLHKAAASGSVELIELLVKNKALVNARTHEGETPLHLAVTEERVEAVNALIKNGATVNAKDESSWIPFHHAAFMGQKEIIQILIENNALVNAEAEDNFTPLDSAVQGGHKDVVDHLLSIGAKITDSSLMYAVECNKQNILETLIAKGASLNKAQGAELLLKASGLGHRGIVEFLLKHKIDVNSRGYPWGSTGLQVASRGGHTKVVITLLENGADVNLLDDEREGPLNYAISGGQLEVVKILIAKGARIDVGKLSKNPLLSAVDRNMMPIVKQLLKHNVVDINSRSNDTNLWTALHVAVQNNNLSMVEYLVSQGSDLHARNQLGSKPINMAARDGFIEIVQFFLDKGMSLEEPSFSKQTLLHYATQEPKNLEMLTFLIKKGSVIDAQDGIGQTPLHVAAKFGNEKLIKLLLDNGAKYNVADNSGGIPFDRARKKNAALVLELTEILFKAVKANNLFEVKQLIRLGASVNARNSDGATPLHFAAWKGFENVVEMLLDNKANPNAKGKGGATPLHYACKHSHLKIVQALLRKGARFNTVCDNGKTPLNFREDKGVITLLETVEGAFENVKKGNAKVINDLNKIDTTMLKAVMGAQNENGRTLIAVAISSNFPKLEDLKQVGQLKTTNVLKAIEVGKVLLSEGKWEVAFNLFNEIYEQRKAILGPENPATLEIEMYLAEVEYKKGAHQESLKLFEEIIEKQKSVLDNIDHQDILNARGRSALVLFKLRRFNEAHEIFEDVRRKQKELLGEYHPDTMTSEGNFAMVLQSEGKLDEAVALFESQYEARKCFSGGEDNQGVLSMRNNMAATLQLQGKDEEALNVFKDVYARKKKVLGINHCDTMRTLRSIADILGKQKKYGEALKILKEILITQEKVLGKDHLETLSTEYVIANFFYNQNKMSEALKIFRKILGKLKALNGASDPLISDIEKKIRFIESQKQGNLGANVWLKLLKAMESEER